MQPFTSLRLIDHRLLATPLGNAMLMPPPLPITPSEKAAPRADCPAGSGCRRLRAGGQSTHLACAAQFELAQAAPLFDPAEHLLDAPAGVDRLGVAVVAGGAAIDG